MIRVFLMFAVLVMPSAGVQIQQYHSHDFSFRAQVAGNPFDVEMDAELTGPDGVRLTVPGFYDGADVWKIRFSPTHTGKWTLRTRSTLAALNGKTENDIECIPNRHAAIHGGLRIDPAHPYHFRYEDGAHYFLMGYECDWLWGIDMNDPKRAQMHKLIDRIAARGFNHVLVNVYAHDTSWSPGKQNQWDYGPPEMFAWAGTNEKPDHTRLNVDYFRLYDGMMEALRDKGLVAHLMLKVYNKKVNWPEKNSPEERKYFRYVVARYQAFSNVVWDFSKESYNEKDNELQARLLEYIRSLDAYKRLTTAHDDDAFEWDPRYWHTLDFRTDQQHSDYAAMVAFDRNMRARPVINSEFGYERGVDVKLPTYRKEDDWEEQLRRAYWVYLAGGYGVYYYHYTSWDVNKIDPEPPGVARFEILRKAFETLPYWRMSPADRLAVGGPCLALPGEVYAVYAEKASVTVNLVELPGLVKAVWINTWTGANEAVPLQGGGVRKVEKPENFGKAPGLLIVRKEL
ncbi:MAG: DUF4038 domain-containing protein [Acidobacteria bacterium]|nr:DUF4038 domain-containing protein [Acidobacteriota bacterium]